jgi:hypothetical protein
MKRTWLADVALVATASLFHCAAGPVTLAGKPITVPVALPSAAGSRNLMLRIDGVQVNPQQGAILRIFAELPGANRSTSVDDEHFVGHITLLARAGPKSRAGSNMVLNVPASAEKWLKNRRTARITFVPMSEGEVSIGKVQFTPSTQ